jgi:hypothetical protein
MEEEKQLILRGGVVHGIGLSLSLSLSLSAAASSKIVISTSTTDSSSSRQKTGNIRHHRLQRQLLRSPNMCEFALFVSAKMTNERTFRTNISAVSDSSSSSSSSAGSCTAQ